MIRKISFGLLACFVILAAVNAYVIEPLRSETVVLAKVAPAAPESVPTGNIIRLPTGRTDLPEITLNWQRTGDHYIVTDADGEQWQCRYLPTAITDFEWCEIVRG
jgi:hypothetical protein